MDRTSNFYNWFTIFESRSHMLLLKCFERYYSFIEEIVKSEITSLCDFNIKIIVSWAVELGITPEFILASNMNFNGEKTALIVDKCKKMHTDMYVSGIGAKAYMDIEQFVKNSIKVIYSRYYPKSYPQRGKSNFIPYLSTLDLLMNVGPEEAREIVLN